ncbi:hypothetical protein G6F54_014132 [Rhizopus delemar]|nr:hypothetical protein G6F54_014132 [Rhizopus delemar]
MPPSQQLPLHQGQQRAGLHRRTCGLGSPCRIRTKPPAALAAHHARRIAAQLEAAATPAGCWPAVHAAAGASRRTTGGCCLHRRPIHASGYPRVLRPADAPGRPRLLRAMPAPGRH